MKKLILGSDHAGYEMKEQVKTYLISCGFDVEDVGTFSADSCNYPEIAHKLCAKIQSGEQKMGILICGTGVGMSMAANKHRGIRAACCSDVFSARLTRQHNNANVLCFGARVIGIGTALDLVDAFVNTGFEGGKHQVRVDMITAVENGDFH